MLIAGSHIFCFPTVGSVLDRTPMRRHLFALLCLLSLLLATQAGYGRVHGSGRRHPYWHRSGYGYGTRGHGYGRPRGDRYSDGGYGKPLGGHGGDYDRPRNAGYGAGGYGRPLPTQAPPCKAPCHPSYGLPGAEGCTCPDPEPETTTAPRTADNEITIAFFAAKPSGGADFRRKRDGANASLPDDAILMNYLVDAWSDSLSGGKLSITFIPYADIPASPVTMTTVKDAKDFISNTYAALPGLPAGKDPSQEAVVKAYQSRATAKAERLTKAELLMINIPNRGRHYS
ncbi:hypothetical protein AAVH_34490 [Aphelenchoides avenae]|nr:hypothetical protein AAVH_34490 [Aphelenchus avenae]